MPTIIQDLHEEITNELRNLETDKDKEQVIINCLLKMIHCLSYDVYNNNNINMHFLGKNEVIEQYKQSVMNIEKVDFFGSVIQKIHRLKKMTMVIEYENNPGVLYDSYYL